MKHIVIITSILFLSLNASAFSVQSDYSSLTILKPTGKSTEIRANLKQARYLKEHGKYEDAVKKLERVLYLDPSNTEAQDLLSLCQEKINEQIQREEAAYKSACQTGTLQALKDFVSNYPKSKFSVDANNRIRDYQLWETAKNKNTKSAYLDYLSQSSLKCYRKEAENAIFQFEATEEWDRCKNTESISEVEEFVKKYGKTQYAQQAQYRLNILKGEKYYRSGDKALAYTYLSNANSFSSLTGVPAEYLNALKEERTFNEMKYCSDIEKVRNYLYKLSSDSPYYIPTANHLALLLGAKLNAYSTEYSMNEALSYAQDEVTRNTVKNNIQAAKDSYAQIRKHQRKAAHKLWWKENFKIGIDGDIETNIGDETGADLFYSAGLLARFGSYKHPFSLTFGVKYRWFRVKLNADDIYDYNSKYDLYGGAICIPLNLRYNIAKISEMSKLYLGAGGEFGVSMIEASDAKGCFEKNFISVYPQIGITSPNFEISLYWKSYLNGPFVKDISEYLQEFKCKSIVGLQMSIYF